MKTKKNLVTQVLMSTLTAGIFVTATRLRSTPTTATRTTWA